jgi:hypothetical protein
MTRYLLNVDGSFFLTSVFQTNIFHIMEDLKCIPVKEL